MTTRTSTAPRTSTPRTDARGFAPPVERTADRTGDLEREVAQLQHALRTRPRIDHVVGILMLLLGCSDEVAWLTLSRVSQNTNRKVVDVAEAVATLVSTGTPVPDDLVAVFRRAMPGADGHRGHR